MLQIGSLVDNKYKILNEVGHGGMSVVYLAINERANKTWAIKEVRKDGVLNFDAVKQGLVVETNMLKRLSHPHLPSIIDVIDTEDSFLIVMDYIEGKSLQSVLQNGGAQPQEQVVEWGKQLCDVLGYLHSRQPAIIYRDMKPANVMLKPDGNVMLIDFGTAREFKNRAMVEDTTCLGTRGYAAPEQFGGYGQTDGRTDIYCLGATLYHLLTGHSPADPPYEIKPLSYWDPSYAGTGIEKLINKCCQQDPAARYQNCEELMYALEHLKDEDDRVIRSRRRKMGAFFGSAAICVAGLLGMLGFGIAGSNAQSQTYEYYVEDANRASELADVRENCLRAIELQPDNVKAYNVLVDFVTRDNSFSADEQMALRICFDSGSPRHYIDYLAGADSAGFDSLQYRIGYSYFFFCGHQEGMISQSAQYFQKAMNSTTLEQPKRNLSEKLYRIANGYQSINGSDSQFSLNDEEYSYRSFWEDLVSIASGDVTGALDRPVYGIALYSEVAYQVGRFVPQLQRYGSVTRTEMESLLQTVRSGLDNLPLNEEQKISMNDTLQQAYDNLNYAETQCRAQYQARG